MNDPLRDDRPGGAADTAARGREIRIEQLLVAGLDHYFNAQYELAINVWTRVLFLDRGHARARAYIERARGAIAERQREADELLHAAVEACNRGDAPAARRLLTSVVDHGAANEDAMALMQRVDRLERAPKDAPAWLAPAQVAERKPSMAKDAVHRKGRGAWKPSMDVALLVGVIAIVAGAYAWSQGTGASSTAAAEVPGSAPATTEPLPVPAPSAGILRRARALGDGGHLHDALDLLNQIRPEDSLRRDADDLRARIQRQLLAVSRATQPTGTPAAR
jgi:hypothetical protein